MSNEKLSRGDKRGLFWRGGDFARERAKEPHRSEVDARVTRAQGLGGLGGLAAGGATGAVAGSRGGPAGSLVGGYTGAVGGAVAGSSAGGKKAFKNLKREGKIKKNYTSAFGVEH